MKLKNSVLFIFTITSINYSALDIAFVSPYVNKGFSFGGRMHYNQLSIIHYYKTQVQNNKYPMYSNTIYLTPYDGFMEFSDYYIIIGSKKENFELYTMAYTGALMPLFGFYRLVGELGLKINHVDNGESSLFKNIAISSFIKTSIRRYLYEGDFGGYRTAGYKTSYFLCSGPSIGTRKKLDNFSYFEIFTNPQFSLTYYDGLGGKMFDPANFAYGYEKYSEFGLLILDFSVPVGVGFKYRYFTVKVGMAVTTIVGNKTRHLNRNETLVDKVVIDSHNFTLFADVGIHFRKFKQLEREMSN